MAIAPRYQPRGPSGAPPGIPSALSYLNPGFGQREGLGQMAPALQQISGALMEADQRINARRDAVARARSLNEFGQQGTELLQSTMTTADISDPRVVRDLDGQLRAAAGEMLAGFGGSQDARLQLAEQVEVMRGRLMDTAARASVEAGMRNVANQLDSQMGTMVSGVREDPSQFGETISAWRDTLANYADALEPSQAQEYIRTGVQAFAEAAVESILEGPGGIREVESLMRTTPGLPALLGPQAQARISQRVAVARRQDEERQWRAQNRPLTPGEQIESKVSALRRMGVNLTPDQIAGMSGVPVASTNRKLDEYLEVAGALQAFRGGAPLTDEEMRALQDQVVFGGEPSPAVRLGAVNRAVMASGQPPLSEDLRAVLVDLQSNPYLPVAEKVAQARRLFPELDDAAFAEVAGFVGIATPPERGGTERERAGREVEALFTHISSLLAAGEPVDPALERSYVGALTRARREVDPITGQTQVVAVAEPYVDLARQLGIDTADFDVLGMAPREPAAAAGTPAPEAVPSEGPMTKWDGRRPGAEAPTEAAEVPAVEPVPAEQAPEFLRGNEEARRGLAALGDRTIYEVADLMAGPSAVVGRALGGLPGPTAGIAPQMTQVQTTVPLLGRQLVDTLRNNPKYAERERESIEAAVQPLFQSRFWDNPQAFQQQVAGIAAALEIRARAAEETRNDRSLPTDVRRQATVVAKAVRDFMGLLAPPVITSDADLEETRSRLQALPPGSVILRQTPDGTFEERRIPARGAP